MKKIFVTLGLGIILGLFIILNSSNSVVFESLESKTENGNPVFNRVRFIAEAGKDIWLMQQTHQGFHKEFGNWDKLAIVVDKTLQPHTATFYQLPAGEKLNFEATPIPLKARCFACHSNGPRAIRYDGDSKIVKPNVWGKIQVAVWNLRIKSYGRVNSMPAAQFVEGSPFKAKLSVFSEPLVIKTCQRCHSKDSIRNELTVEHLGTARFLVKNGFMPPFPFRMTDEELRVLENYF